MLMVDIIYAFIDPQIRAKYTKKRVKMFKKKNSKMTLGKCVSRARKNKKRFGDG